jgi:hypothetical protein
MTPEGYGNAHGAAPVRGMVPLDRDRTIQASPEDGMSNPADRLVLANRAKAGQIQVRRRLAAGAIDIEEALHDVRATKIILFDLLLCMRGWGVVKTRDLLRGTTIGEQRRVGQLTARQKTLVVEWVDAWNDSPPRRPAPDWSRPPLEDDER